MAKDTFYFSHDYNARSDIKIKRLLSKHGYQGYGIFWALIEDLYNNNNSVALDFETLSFDLRCSIECIESIISDFELFVIEDGFFGSSSVESRLDTRNSKSDKARESVLKRWGKSEGKIHESYATKRSERMAIARQKGTHTKNEWENMRMFFGACLKCGAENDIVKDHIIPIYQEGSDGISNIQPLCRSCNASKGSESIDYRNEFCLRNAYEMPTCFEKMPTIKESIVKENKVKESKVHKEEHCDFEILDQFPFDEFWENYNKKNDRTACEKKFAKLTEKEKEFIWSHVPKYVLSTPDKQYRKNPETYLNNKCWNDEIINTSKNGTGQQNTIVETATDRAYQRAAQAFADSQSNQ